VLVFANVIHPQNSNSPADSDHLVPETKQHSRTGAFVLSKAPGTSDLMMIAFGKG
jgi:hypothetical protein